MKAFIALLAYCHGYFAEVMGCEGLFCCNSCNQLIPADHMQ